MTQPAEPFVSNVPTVWARPRSTTEITWASRSRSASLRLSAAAISTRTRSPSSAVFKRPWRTNTSEPSSNSTKPWPERLTRIKPSSPFVDLERIWTRPPRMRFTSPLCSRSSSTSLNAL